MRKYFILIILLIITMLIFFRREPFAPDTYVGDGKITYKRNGGILSNDPGRCFIDFEPFSLSTEFVCTYNFSGLQPLNKYVDEYAVWLYIPPTTDQAKINEAIIQMTLHSNGVPVNSFELKVRDLWRVRSKGDDIDRGIDDGWRKKFTKRDFRISANPAANYDLTVHYEPQGNPPDENQLGYFYLSMGGEH